MTDILNGKIRTRTCSRPQDSEFFVRNDVHRYRHGSIAVSCSYAQFACAVEKNILDLRVIFNTEKERKAARFPRDSD